ncbi:uncharacterized protein LOC127508786 [Ctenopharyngodon idella]|uniref:uncharacterized protein LOC127508786 n=1 Tax=Ctenopharyngodon idella TaxID=7959 RepID=UPI0022328F1B|nr:uncharacterized protein LOC127508786 [Ctenopharyngodon idella]XP_051743118.1 uncharacterized protein LOC127508786 [Ctenopharyngodon idella]
MRFFCVQNQPPESNGNGKTTCESGGRNPPDVTLCDIFRDLLSFFSGLECLHDAKKNIEKKYDIKKEHGDCWSADDIKRAWGKTQRMDINSSRRKHWAHVIILQMVKRVDYNECKQNAVHEHDDTTCETTPRMKENSEDTSSQSNDELQIWRIGLCASKYKLTEESVSASESHLSTSSTDVAPLPTEVNSNNSETKNAAQVNEKEDTLDNNYEQRKSIDNHEKLHLTDMPDRKKAERENVRWQNGIQSTVDINQACEKAESMKGNSEDRSSLSSDELETVGAAGGDKQSSGANQKSSKSGLNKIDSVSQGQTGTQFLARSQKKCPGAPNDQSSPIVHTALECEAAVDETIYIRIPLSEIFHNRGGVQEDQNIRSKYKLKDGLPSDTNLRRKKSYVMAFNSETRNANWVYEILNRSTTADNYVKPKTFGHDYHRGHLAAAANHRWCEEAVNDTYLNSNLVPQHKHLNNRIWKKLEYYCRNKVNQDVLNVHVYTGPLYLSAMYYPKLREKTVPSHLFKVVIVENEDGTVKEPECYMIPNEVPLSKDLQTYRTNIEYIESVSGLILTERRPDVGQGDRIMTGTFQGEDVNVNIHVRISS